MIKWLFFFFFTYLLQRQVPSNLLLHHLNIVYAAITVYRGALWWWSWQFQRQSLVGHFTVLYISETYFTDIPNLHRWTTQEKSKKGNNDYKNRPKGIQTKSHRNLLLHVLQLWILPTTFKKKIFWQLDFKIGQWYQLNYCYIYWPDGECTNFS